MGLGSNSKSKGAKSTKKDNSSKRYIGSIWQNAGKNGKDDYLSMSIDNLDADSEYYKGNLLWYDKETQKYYRVKSAAVYEADKGPQNLMNKIVIDLENEYHVEEVKS